MSLILIVFCILLTGCSNTYYHMDRKVSFNSAEKRNSDMKLRYEKASSRYPPLKLPIYNELIIDFGTFSEVVNVYGNYIPSDSAVKSYDLAKDLLAKAIENTGIAKTVTITRYPVEFSSYHPNNLYLKEEVLTHNNTKVDLFTYTISKDKQKRVIDPRYVKEDKDIFFQNLDIFINNLINPTDDKLYSNKSESTWAEIAYGRLEMIIGKKELREYQIIDKRAKGWNDIAQTLNVIQDITMAGLPNDNVAKQLWLSQQTYSGTRPQPSTAPVNSNQGNGEPENENLTTISFGVPNNLNDKYGKKFSDVDNKNVGLYSIHFKDTKTTEKAFGYKWKMKLTNIYKECVGIGFAEIISPTRIGQPLTTVKSPEGVHKSIKLKQGESFDSGWLNEWQILNSDDPRYNLDEWKLRIVNVRETSCD